MALQTQTRRNRNDSPARWHAALARAISNALDVYVSTDGAAYVESASTPGLLYAVSREHCTCPAGANGMICQHRACYLAQIGELSLDPEPAPPAPGLPADCPHCCGCGQQWFPSGPRKCERCQGTGRAPAPAPAVIPFRPSHPAAA